MLGLSLRAGGLCLQVDAASESEAAGAATRDRSPSRPPARATGERKSQAQRNDVAERMPSRSPAKCRSFSADRDRFAASRRPGGPSSDSKTKTTGLGEERGGQPRFIEGRPELWGSNAKLLSFRHPLLHWIMLLALVVMWGSSFGLTEIAISTASVDSVVAARLLVAGLFLVVLVVASRKRFPRDGRVWLVFMAMALMGNVLPYWLISWGQETVESGVAGVLMAVMPLVTLVLAHFFVKDDRMTRGKAVGFLVGFLGVVVLINPGASFGLAVFESSLFAQFAIIAGAICYAINTIIARHCSESDSLIAAAGTAIAANLLLVPIAWRDVPAVIQSFDLTSFLAVVILGIVSTALAPILYFHLVRRAGPTFFSLTNYLIPAWALLIGILFLDESPSWTAFAGMGLILGGVAVSQLAKRRGTSTPASATRLRSGKRARRRGSKGRGFGGPEAWECAQDEPRPRILAEKPAS